MRERGWGEGGGEKGGEGRLGGGGGGDKFMAVWEGGLNLVFPSILASLLYSSKLNKQCMITTY